MTVKELIDILTDIPVDKRDQITIEVKEPETSDWDWNKDVVVMRHDNNVIRIA